MSEYPMTLDELLAACKEASDLGEPIELDPLTALALVEDSINLNAVIERMALMLGKDPDAVNVHNMLDEVRDIMADFVALKVVVTDYRNSRDTKVNLASIERVSDARDALFSLMDRLEPKRPSPVLEIAGMNHE